MIKIVEDEQRAKKDTETKCIERLISDTGTKDKILKIPGDQQIKKMLCYVRFHYNCSDVVMYWLFYF